MKLHHTIILTAILATVLVFLCLFIAAGAPKRYSVDYGGAKGLFNKAKDSYREGEKVTMYFDLIATDTDYSFFIDGERINCEYDEDKGYIISFVMPAHDVKVEVETKNSMTYVPE